MMPFFERALTPNGMWNAAIDAAAFEAWCACRNDLYVKSAGLEKVVPKRIRRLRKPTDRTLTESGDAN